ncbi:hypothetical protein BN971_02536 [Mycobacterium bohemicum DSM 44277]|uniref:Uncharacterized protein n=1 Tax=Mycobacterium bohemicum DSM 44277 TaxID=1236609 RepID=A0A0U0W8V8_MYCBE|nr:hypothetical protein [Mycobacterium bohemicum]CPR11256.1 hypothetical protein BN971_02536 [Mycobacterium bohemicum DSM 44277]
MSVNRVVSAAAVALGVSLSAMTLAPGLANSAPMDPPPPCPNCHGGGGGGGNPGGGGGGNPGGGAGGGPQSAPPQTHDAPPPQNPEPQQTQNPQPQQTQNQAPQQTQNQQPQQTQNPQQQTQNQAPQQTQNPQPQQTPNQPPQTQGNGPRTGEPWESPNRGPSGPPNGQTNAPGGPSNSPAGGPQNQPPDRNARPVLNPPSTQPPHPPYVSRHDVVSASAQIGGPGGADVQFNVVGRGAPPPPGGWNRPWAGPPRDVVAARADFGPFNYDTFTVIPVFNWQYGGWGYWFFGDWIPLY